MNYRYFIYLIHLFFLKLQVTVAFPKSPSHNQSDGLKWSECEWIWLGYSLKISHFNKFINKDLFFKIKYLNFEIK